MGFGITSDVICVPRRGVKLSGTLRVGRAARRPTPSGASCVGPLRFSGRLVRPSFRFAGGPTPDPPRFPPFPPRFAPLRFAPPLYPLSVVRISPHPWGSA